MSKVTVNYGTVTLQIDGDYTVESVQPPYPPFDEWNGETPPTIRRGMTIELDDCTLTVEDLKLDEEGFPVVVAGGKDIWLGELDRYWGRIH